MIPDVTSGCRRRIALALTGFRTQHSVREMNIRIVTSHPALQHVLRRTAPMGTTVRVAPRTHAGPTYAIKVDLAQRASGERSATLEAWLPAHVRHYGVERVEIDGRAVSTDDQNLRRALASRVRPRGGESRRPVEM